MLPAGAKARSHWSAVPEEAAVPSPTEIQQSYATKGLTPLQAERTATMASPGAKRQHDPNVV